MYTFDVKPGDIIGFSGRSWVSAGINVATYGIPFWNVSHVGIIGRARGRSLLFESTEFPNEDPCEITGEPIVGTQAHSLEFVLTQYKGAAWHYPLYRPLYRHEDTRLTMFLLDTIGREYDLHGAMRSGGNILSSLEFLFRRQDILTLFCSEWVVSAISHIGLYPTSNVSAWSPNKLVRRLRRCGIIGKPQRLK